jgi:hypothetical protein
MPSKAGSKSAKDSRLSKRQAYIIYKYFMLFRNILEKGTRLDFASDHWHRPEIRVEEIDICDVMCAGGSAMTIVITESR